MNLIALYDYIAQDNVREGVLDITLYITNYYK